MIVQRDAGCRSVFSQPPAVVCPFFVITITRGRHKLKTSSDIIHLCLSFGTFLKSRNRFRMLEFNTYTSGFKYMNLTSHVLVTQLSRQSSVEYKTRCIPKTYLDFLPPISNIHCVDRYLFNIFLIPTLDLTLPSPNHHVVTRTMHCSTSSNLSRASAMFVTVFALFTSVCTGLPAAGSNATAPGP